MIVLGQHVLAHSYEPPTENGDGGNSTSVQATDALKTGGIHFDVPPDTTIIEGQETFIKQWHDARHQVSAMLGSTGAVPIASYPPMNFTWASNCDAIHATIVSSYLHATLQLASSHVPLIRAMNDALDTIKTGASLRLGLGPTNLYFYGNGGLVSRAEKAWAQRRPRNDPETCSEDGNGSRSRYPRLTLLRSRRIIYQVMVDQATSLRSIMNLFHGDESRAVCDWNEFIDDMQYFSQLLPKQAAPVLTLSKLSFWINGLRGLLSFVLSQLLADRFGMDDLKIDWNGLVSLLKQSSQFAKERVHFLTSAFDLSRSSRVESVTPQTPNTLSESNLNDAESNRNALKLIHQLQSTLEAAQVSLWAFCQSFIKEEGKPFCDSQDPTVWWSQLKELLSQTEVSMGHFENSFLATPSSGNEEETAESAEDPSCTINDANTNSGIELFVDIVDAYKEGSVSNTNNSLATTEEHADKTLIFSGSGLHKKSQPAGKGNSGGDSAMLSTSRETFNQTILMCDLRKRLKTMQVAEEHEVISLDACKEDSLHSKPIYRRAAPFFLGVEGSLFTELASALACNKDQVNILGDSIP